MTDTIKQLSWRLQQVRNPLADLLGFLTDLTELARTFYVELFRAAAKANPTDKTKVAAYKTALESVYGLTITVGEGVTVTFGMLDEYLKGLNDFSSFLEKTYGEKLSDYDRYLLFQAVMGKMTLFPTLSRNVEEAGKTSRGYSAEHTIWDMYTYIGSDGATHRFTIPMTANNLIHELFHSFNKFAGFGGMGLGTLFTEEFEALREKFQEDTMNNPLRENPKNDASEILADLGLFYAKAYIPGSYEGVDLDKVYKRAIRQAMLYHTSPQDYARATKRSITTAALKSDDDAIVRFNSVIGGSFSAQGKVLLKSTNALRKEIPAGSEVFVLGRSPKKVGSENPQDLSQGDQSTASEFYWIYVAYRFPGEQTTFYGWVRADRLSSGAPSVETLREISFSDVDPEREFAARDKYNPPY